MAGVVRLLRLFAALAVVVGHGCVLIGTSPPPRVGGIPLHTLGLYVFFAVSGYVITRSWNRCPDPRMFLRNRALRILPGLGALILITVLVLGPLATRLPLGEYLTGADTWRYLSGLLLVPRYVLPGVFTDHSSPTVNGSLWTLGIEACCYLATAILGLTLRRFAWTGALLLGGAAVMLAVQPAGGPLEPLRAVGAVCSYFALGAITCHLHLDRRPLPLPLTTSLTGVWVLVGTIHPPVAVALAWVVIPAVVLTIAGRSAGPDSRTDLSYGVYLWGYPIQQLVLQINPDLPTPFSLSITVVVTLAAAALSWAHVEHPALRLKRAAPSGPRPEPVAAGTRSPVDTTVPRRRTA
jgi:peptidoglycan/LPS O-acetylase OafA/YrhL